MLGSAKSATDLGKKFGTDLYEAEVLYLIRNEWAVTAEDVLWRRTKRGLRLSPEEARVLEEYLRDVAGGTRTEAA